MNMPPSQSRFSEQLKSVAACTRRARIKAAAEFLVLALFVAMSASLGTNAHEAVMAGVLAVSLALPIYVYRRGKDLERLARQSKWRDDAVEGQGVPLSSWIGGAKLENWEKRSDSARR